MAAIQLNHSSFETPRSQPSGIHSALPSPQLRRPSSQASLHLPLHKDYSPLQHSDLPMSAYPGAHPQPFKFYQPNMSLPMPPSAHLNHQYPNSAPPMAYYPEPQPIYDTRNSQPMFRTISHAHPMNSATDHTASSRYSSSPHSATGAVNDGPASATLQGAAYSIHTPMLNMQELDGRHVNPNLFNNSNYPMSRSTSGATEESEYGGRLLTPGYDYRSEHLNPTELELRKVSDSLGRANVRFYPQIATPAVDLQSHAMGFPPYPHPQPGFYYGRPSNIDGFNMSAERSDTKPDLVSYQAENDYEREREMQIVSNRRLLEDVGLGGGNGFSRQRQSSGISSDRIRKVSTPMKKRLQLEAHVRASPRIASLHRNVSYADLDGGPVSDQSDEEQYDSEQEYEEEEDDFRPSKRSRGGGKMAYKRKAHGHKHRAVNDLSLYGLLEVYPLIPRMFPLFYYTLNNDLTINSDSVPLIGSIPSTVTPVEKGNSLQAFFHRGRRVLAQLDAFCTRCDRKYEGPEERWPEVEHFTRVAIRDVRRKIVERCENYKYTRRDLLDKLVGKNKWQPIEHGMIAWDPTSGNNDPANDLCNVTLTLPTPPPGVYAQRSASQQQQQQQAYKQPQAYPERQIRAIPSRARLVSNAGARSISVTMADPDSAFPHTGVHYAFSQHGHTPTAPPAYYGEHDVPMTVQMPGSMSGSSVSPLGSAGLNPTWANDVKDEKLEEGETEHAQDTSAEDLSFEQQPGTLWQE